jgi:TP901 family phage tail tape measure protein
MVAGKNTIEIILAARDRTRAAFAKVNTQMRTLGVSTGKLNTGMGSLRSSFTNLRGSAGKLGAALGPLGLAAVAAAAAIAIASIGVAAVRSFAEFEDAMASVRKTTGFTKSEIKVLGDAINTLALRIPVAQTELAGIAAVAGQLGIQGKEDILSFTETVAMMTTAFDMPAEAVAIAMAKLGKIYNIPIEQTSNLGSAINVLGNTTAASESQIMAFSMALGPAAQQLGFAATEAISLGASMISMGMDASSAGTRLNRAFTMIGKNLDEVAEFMKIPAETFVESFEGAPMETFLSIIDKLSQVEGKLKANTIAAEIFGEIGAKGIKSIAEDIDGVRTNLANSNEQFRENTSLAEEFAAKTDTLNAKFQIFGNTVESFKIQIGEALAPLTGKLTEVATMAVKGLGLAFDVMMKLAGPALDLIFIKIKLLRAFMEGLFTPIIRALAPLMNSLKGISGGFGKLKGVITLVSDVVTILTSAATKLGSLLGNLLVKVLTPLIAKTQEGINTASDIYDKLGPIKGAIESVTGAIHDLAEAEDELTYDTKAVMDSVNGMTASLEDLEASAVSAPTAIIKAWKTATDAFGEGTGSMKDAASEINKEIEIQIGLWKQAADEDRFFHEDNLRHLGEQLRAIEETDKAEREHLATFINGTTKAIEKQKDFIVTIGNTTIEFKGAAAEVLKNADAYEKLQKAAKTFTDLDWSVFHDFEAALPNINTGIGGMESAFVGFSSILEDNIGKLENIKESVMGISGIAAPFLEAGFLNGIKAIGDFAGALKNAGSAIHDFTSLQDVSIDGAINFSLHVRDMVSALQILEGQMEDLMPSFDQMNSLIIDTVESFIWTGGQKETVADEINKAAVAHRQLDRDLKAGLITQTKYYEQVKETGHITDVLSDISSDSFGVIYDYYTRYIYGVEDANEITKDFLNTSGVAEKQMNKQTDALKFQTDQLAKITDALQPYLNFMRTLNELATLSTLSTEELNAGLNSIKDTLVNLGTALSGFDLRDAMEGLFAPAGTPGSARGFMDTMEDYQTEFNEVIKYTIRLTTSITDLVVAFDLLADIGDSVLSDQTKLKKVFEDIVLIMSNFSAEMGEAGFADAIAKGMDAMIKSADPLISYFDKNNASVIKFNNTLGTFKTTITHVVDVMNLVKEMSEMVLPSVDELGVGFDKAEEAVQRFDEALLKHLGISTEGHKKGMFEVIDEEAFSSNIITWITQFADSWSLVEKALGDNFKTFEEGITTITSLITNIASLASAFESMKDISMPSATEMGDVFDGIGKSIKDFTSMVSTEFPKITPLLTTFHTEWLKHKKTIDETLPSLKEAINTYTTLISLAISLTSAYASLAVKEGELAKIRVISAEDLAATLKDVPAIITQMKGLLEAPIWGEIIADLSEFAPVWDEISEGVQDSINSFSAAIGAFASIINAAVQLTDTFTDMKDIVVISVDQMTEAFEDIPEGIDEVTKYLATESFGNVENALKRADGEWLKHKEIIDNTLPSFVAAIDTISTLATKVLSLSSAFEELKVMSVLSIRDIDEAMKKIPLFLNRFVDALKLNMHGIKEALSELNLEWAKHAEEMGDTMPTFTTATNDIGTLIGTILSLNSALEELRSMGVIREREFNRGFENLTKSIANFATSLTTNVDALVFSLQKLRVVWVENEAVLFPLIRDFAIISDNLYGVAHNANRMAKEFDALSKNSGTLEKGFKSLIDFINQVVKATKEFYTTEAAAELAGFIEDVGKVIETFVDLEIELKGAMSKIKSAISNAVDNIEGKINSLSTLVISAYHSGANVMGAFITGIYSMSDALTTAVAQQAMIVDDYLGASSPTRLGPLARLDEWPRNLIQSYSAGIEAEIHTLNSSFSGLAPGMGAGSAGGSNKKINLYITQHISDRDTADYANNELGRLLSRHAVM